MNVIPEMNPLNRSSSLSLRRSASARPLLLLSFLAALSFATGCHKNNNGIPPASSLGPSADSSSTTAPTATITADPLAIDLGSTVVLNWRTTNATSVTIDGIGPVPINGTQTVAPSNSTNFHLTAKGEGGSVEANVRVTVRAPTVATPGGTVMGVDSHTNVTDEQFRAAVQDMFFDYDSYDLRPDAQTVAGQSAAFLAQHPEIRLLIGGYADERGSAEYNLALGENRANAAKAGLVNAGVASTRIRVISYGKEKQFCSEATDACWQENRRAQFTIDR